MAAKNGNSISAPTELLGRAGTAALVIARIGTVFLWIAAATTAVVLVAFIVASGTLTADYNRLSLNVGGVFSISITGQVLDYSIYLQQYDDAPINTVAVIATGVSRTAIFALLALAFGQVAALCDELNTWVRHAEQPSTSPFRAVISERLSHMGWYLIATPVVALANYIVCTLAGASGSAGVWLSGLLVMIGIMLLLLSRIFDYGMSLEQEVDGLL
ncbi:hypothetical protein [Bifidobacterium scaligerum]|uniref:DUF2975 domain-containing protein n=1 Tax=Bifidobacterium scaligerum TaxID=2052656 RepID=A0A2M9HPV2_9BIFI|nr:hypothetical protein [Bifidobacterium scaligerum]PJM78848.1 hypothetical protein CUU80_07770 [Bifidobacterium scaligerum]